MTPEITEPTETLKDLVRAVQSETALGGHDEMAAWSDDRRKLFVETLRKRSIGAATVLRITADRIVEAAASRRFISPDQVSRYNEARTSLVDVRGAAAACGREPDELRKIAETRAAGILNQLPTLKDALVVMAPELVSKLGRKAKLTAAGQRLTVKLNETSQPIIMSEQPQDMTLRDFRKLITAREDLREKLHTSLEKIAVELHAIERAIAMVLVKGVPELSTEIIKTAKAQLEQAEELGQFERRMSEQVMFGDSELAQNVLKQYEHDELALSSELTKKFKEALNKYGIKRGAHKAALNG